MFWQAQGQSAREHPSSHPRNKRTEFPRVRMLTPEQYGKNIRSAKHRQRPRGCVTRIPNGEHHQWSNEGAQAWQTRLRNTDRKRAKCAEKPLPCSEPGDHCEAENTDNSGTAENAVPNYLIFARHP